MPLLTEAQANAVWCPHSGPNGYGRTESPNTCSSAACSQWRWGEGKHDSMTGTISPGPEWRSIDLINWVRDKPNRRGYCGLAGKPEFDE
jgi:hypothetical protein